MRYAVATWVVAALLTGCAHQLPAPTVAAPAPAEPTYAVAPWTGDVRVAAGSAQDELQGQDVTLVEGVVRDLLAQMGVKAKVQCLERDGDIAVKGALHAQIRVEFAHKLTVDQKLGALNALESLRPTESAFVLPPAALPPPARAALPVAPGPEVR